MHLATAIAIATSLALAASPAAALDTASEIDACVRAQLRDRTSEQTLALTTRDRMGLETRIDAKVYWRAFDDGLSRFLIRITAPADMRGSGLLLIERTNRHDMFMYVPALDRARRITSRMVSTSLFGTDFSYEEIARLQGVMRDGNPVRRPDESTQGRAVFVLESRPTDKTGSAYSRVVRYVDQQTCIPLRIRYYGPGGKLRKELSIDATRIQQVEGRRVPMRMVMRDLREETSTELVVREIELGKAIPRSVFSQRHLESTFR